MKGRDFFFLLSFVFQVYFGVPLRALRGHGEGGGREREYPNESRKRATEKHDGEIRWRRYGLVGALCGFYSLTGTAANPGEDYQPECTFDEFGLTSEADKHYARVSSDQSAERRNRVAP